MRRPADEDSDAGVEAAVTEHFLSLARTAPPPAVDAASAAVADATADPAAGRAEAETGSRPYVSRRRRRWSDDLDDLDDDDLRPAEAAPAPAAEAEAPAVADTASETSGERIEAVAESDAPAPRREAGPDDDDISTPVDWPSFLDEEPSSRAVARGADEEAAALWTPLEREPEPAELPFAEPKGSAEPHHDAESTPSRRGRLAPLDASSAESEIEAEAEA